MSYVTLSRVLRGLRRPTYAIGVGRRLLTKADERFLADVTGAHRSAIAGFIGEPWSDSEFRERMQECERVLRGMGKADVADKRTLSLIHAAVRALRPAVVVETGVKHGWSTAYILRALKENGAGHLHSIDQFERVGDGPDFGWVVPDSLREDWTFHVGDSREVLPQLLQSLGGTDVFFHDSRHVYDHMMWEFEAAFPAIRPGGLLLSDDAVWNDAFRDFARRVGASQAQVLSGLGVLLKERS